MPIPAAGKHRCFTSNKAFFVALGATGSVVLTFNGKMGGTVSGNPAQAGQQLSGNGLLEYTYIRGATEWVRTDMEDSAVGPSSISIPFGNLHHLVYRPGGKCHAKVSIEVSGDPVVETLGFKHKKDLWKMKGRTQELTISVAQEVDSIGPIDDAYCGANGLSPQAYNYVTSPAENWRVCATNYCNDTFPVNVYPQCNAACATLASENCGPNSCYDPTNNTVCADSGGDREWCVTGAPVGCVDDCQAIIDGGLCG